jgi:hypothetical protein
MSPTLFNIVVDAVVRYWFSLVSEDPEDAVSGLQCRVKEHCMLFYAEDGMIGSHDPKWLQESFDVLVELFKCIMGLWTNVDKTKVMICTPRSLQTRESDISYKRRQTRQGKSFHARKQQQVNCTERGKSLVTGSLKSHMEMQHGLDLPCIFEMPAPPMQFTMSFPAWAPLSGLACPVARCGYIAKTWLLMRWHFAD